VRFGKRTSDHMCIDAGAAGATGVGILECYTRYCIYDNGSGSFTCNQLTTTNTNYTGKHNTTGVCLAYNTANSLYCAYGLVCLDVSDSDKCVSLTSTVWIGREYNTDKCLPANSGNAALCKGPSYCRLTSSVPVN